MRVNRLTWVLAFGSVLGSVAKAAEIVEVLPLTSQILMVHFDEGSVIHHRKGQKRSDEQVLIQPLDVARASSVSSYRIESKDDPAYRAPQVPGKVYRKAKGTDFAWFVDSWVDGRAVNNRPDHVQDHWVYLALRSPLVEGKTYQLATDLGTNAKTFSLRFQAAKSRSEAVHVNLLGYVPTAPQKFAYVYHWMGDGGSLDVRSLVGRKFAVVNHATHAKELEGTLAFRKPKDNRETQQVGDSPPFGNFLGADVAEADFSALQKPGAYVVSVEGVGCSFLFEIKADALRPAFRATARALYHNRSGIALVKPFTEFERPAPHNPKLTPGFGGKLKYTSVPYQDWGSEGGVKAVLDAGIKGNLDAYGWYQDAGDWDSYVTHLRVATELLFSYEMRPRNFKDGELNIPESKNGVPDVLDEAAWLPRFCRRIRLELKQKGWGTGGLGLRVAGDAYGEDGEGVPSYEDVNRTWVASGEDPVSTIRYAGAAAHLAYAFSVAKVADPEGVDWTREAEEAYAWAMAHRAPKFEEEMKVHRIYAAAALARLTGEASYGNQLAADTGDLTATSELWFESAYGPGIVALGGPKMKLGAALVGRLRGAILKTADLSCETAGKRGLRWGGLEGFPMLVGHQTTPWMLEVMLGWGATRVSDPAKATRYLAALYTTADYFLGTNPLNQTWITGIGERFPTAIFHMDAWYNGKGRFHEGLIPYSPWRKEREFGPGPWDQHWGQKAIYPANVDLWPGAERWWSNRCSPMGSEFTVHQNIGPAAAFYGFLSASR